MPPLLLMALVSAVAGAVAMPVGAARPTGVGEVTVKAVGLLNVADMLSTAKPAPGRAPGSVNEGPPK